MHRDSIDPAYWRKKAAEFRWLAQSAGPREAQVLARRAAEFAVMAALLQGQDAGPAAARPPAITGRWLVLAACLAGGLAAGVATLCLDRGGPAAIAAARPEALPGNPEALPGNNAAAPARTAPASSIATPPAVTNGTAATAAPPAPEPAAVEPADLAMAVLAPRAAAAEPAPQPAAKPRRAKARPIRAVRRHRHRPVAHTIRIFGYRVAVLPPPNTEPRPIP